MAAIPHPAFEDVVARTQRDVTRVLNVAEKATDPQEVREVAKSLRKVAGTPHVPTESPARARQLNAQARAAFEDDDVERALALQNEAVRANPNDPEITGNFAFYHLKSSPMRPEVARQLALYALAARGESFPVGRFQDWGTLAVASALEGRKSDATTAMYVMLSVSKHPERACRAARLAVQHYGEALREPAEAMMARARARGDGAEAPSCR